MKTIMGLLTFVECERQGQQINRDVAKRLMRMLLALQTYRERFEQPFLEESARFFTAEGQRLLNELDASQFLVHVERRLLQAADMVQSYLDSATKRPLIEAIEQHLLKPHAQAILDRGFEQLLNGDKLADLHRMFSLFCRIGAQDSLRDAFSGYIRRHGEDIINDTTREKEMISDLLVFQQRMVDAVMSAFANDDRFRLALKNSFEHFMNLKANKVAEFMAKFVDKQLRVQKGANDTEVESTLEHMLTLFRHLNSKDMFETFYRKQLAKRLLLSTSASDELERSMIVKLKSECGSNFTSKLEGMLKDIDLSRDLKEHVRPASIGLLLLPSFA
jgi:cullin-4